MANRFLINSSQLKMIRVYLCSMELPENMKENGYCKSRLVNMLNEIYEKQNIGNSDTPLEHDAQRLRQLNLFDNEEVVR